LAALLCAVACGPLACGLEESSDSPPRPAQEAPTQKRVFLISLDTLRKDAIGVYRGGASGESDTPALDAFARDAVRVEGARTPMPFTLPAHMSLLTGVAPRVHGVSRGDRQLSGELGTLPEWLRAAGFATHGVVVNYWMKGGFGFERGFDSYQLVQDGLVSSGRVNAALAGALAAAGDGPLFVFAQYFDVHSASSELTMNTLPYYSPPEYRRDLPADSDASQARGFCDAAMGCATGFLSGADAAGLEVAPEKLARVRELYQRSVRHLDAQLAEFLEQLKHRGLYRDSLIIVTADHGEEFREHGRFLHSQTYDETLAVPLLVKLPADMAGARRGQRAVGLAMLEDIAPTILDVFGLPPSQTAQGVSLLPLLLRGEAVREVALSQDKSRRSRHALVADGYKLIYDFEGGAAELYDLSLDPVEVRDLASLQPERTAQLQRRLAAQVRHNTRLAERFRASARTRVLSDEEQQALRAMGYLADDGSEEPSLSTGDGSGR